MTIANENAIKKKNNVKIEKSAVSSRNRNSLSIPFVPFKRTKFIGT